MKDTGTEARRAKYDSDTLTKVAPGTKIVITEVGKETAWSDVDPKKIVGHIVTTDERTNNNIGGWWCVWGVFKNREFFCCLQCKFNLYREDKMSTGTEACKARQYVPTQEEVEAVKNTVKQWNWLAQNPDKNKDDYFVELQTPIADIPPRKCYLCKIWRKMCDYEIRNCPLATLELHCTTNDRCGTDSPFDAWAVAKLNPTQRKIQALRIVQVCEEWLAKYDKPKLRYDLILPCRHIESCGCWLGIRDCGGWIQIDCYSTGKPAEIVEDNDFHNRRKITIYSAETEKLIEVLQKSIYEKTQEDDC